MPLWKKQHLARYMEQANDGTSGSAGGGGAPDVQAQIAAAVEAATAGLKAKNTELLGSLREAKDSLKRFEGIDPDAVRNIISKFASDEEATLIAAGKVDEVLNKRTERMKADFDKKLVEAQAKADAAVKRAETFQGRVLDEAIRAAASKAGLHQHAIDDALFRGRAMFTLNEDGTAISLGDDGQPVLGKDGKTPFTPGEWLETMKDKAPHWYPATAAGSGAASSTGAPRPGSPEMMKLSPVERINAARGVTRK